MLAVLVLVASALQFQNVLAVPLREIYPIGDARHDAISNLELFLPILMKGYGSDDKRDTHHPKLEVKENNLDLLTDNPSEYNNHNVDILPDLLYKPMVVKNINKKPNSVKKQLKSNFDDNIMLDMLKNKNSNEPKPVPIQVIKACDRLHNMNHEISNIKLEIAMHYCKELLDAIINNEDSSTSEEEDDETDDSEEKHIHDSSVENFDLDECPCCPEYVIPGPNHFDDHDLVKEGPPRHYKMLDGPVRLFGPYNGRRDWMVLSKQYPSKLKNFVNNYKRPKFF